MAKPKAFRTDTQLCPLIVSVSVQLEEEYRMKINRTIVIVLY